MAEAAQDDPAGSYSERQLQLQEVPPPADAEASTLAVAVASPRLVNRERLNEIYRHCSAAVEVIRYAGDPRYEDYPLHAVEHLKQWENLLYSEVPEAALPVRYRCDYSGVSSRLAGGGATFNEAYERALAQRAQQMQAEAAERAAWQRSTSSPGTRKYHDAAQSRYHGLFSEGQPREEEGVSELFHPPPDDANPRLQVQRKQALAAAKMDRHSRGNEAAQDSSNSTHPKHPQNSIAKAEFVPRVYLLPSRQASYEEGVAKRKAIEEKRKLWQEKMPAPHVAAAAAVTTPRAAAIAHAVTTATSTSPSSSRRAAKEPLRVPKDFVPRVAALASARREAAAESSRGDVSTPRGMTTTTATTTPRPTQTSTSSHRHSNSSRTKPSPRQPDKVVPIPTTTTASTVTTTITITTTTITTTATSTSPPP